MNSLKNGQAGDSLAIQKDGSVVIEIDIDDKEAQKELNRLTKKIDALQDKLDKKTSQRSELAQEVKQIGMEADEARKKLEYMQSGEKFFTTSSIKEQQAAVSALEKQWDKARIAADKLDAEIYDGTQSMIRMKEEAGQIQRRLASTGPALGVMSTALDRMQVSAHRFSMRLREVVKSALVFTVISQGLASLREWFGRVIRTNDEAVDAMARLKGALLTLAQPIVNVVLPAFTAFLNILTKIIYAIANVVSALFGTTIEASAEAAENLYGEADAIESVGAAAEEASGSLASFDEINQLSSSAGSGGSGGIGGVGTDEIKPIFEDFNTAEYKAKIDEITAYLSGALLALGAILAFSGVNIPLGLALMAAGAVGLVSLLAQDWNAMDSSVKAALTRVMVVLGAAALAIGAILCFSGANVPLGIGLMIAGAASLGTAVALNWATMDQNIQQAIVGILEIIGAALLVIGAILTFSGANLPLGIGLMLAGAASLATAAALNWELTGGNIKAVITEITLLLGASLLAVGAVIALSGANLPLGIGLMIAGAVSLATAAALNWDSIVEALKGEIGIITAMISAALLVLGAVIAFSGANLPLGIALLAAGAVGLVSVVALNWNAIATELQGEIGRITAFVSASLLVLGIILCLSGVGIPLGISLIAAGAVGLVTVAAVNWDAILDKLKEVWRDITSWFNTSVKKYLSLDYWKGVGSDILNGLWDGLKSVWSSITGWVSDKVSWITSKFSNTKATVSAEYDLPDAQSYNLQKSRAIVSPQVMNNVPHLARGTVVPPNREFLAVLGDNTRETEVVSPVSTMKQAFIEAMREMGMGDGTFNFTVNLDGKTVAKNTVKHINNMTRQAGKPVLLF